MGSIDVSIQSNVNSVIRDIDDVEDDLRHEMRKRVGAAMRVLRNDARQYVLDDPNYRGNLFRSIEFSEHNNADGIEFSVHTDPKIAEYAALVEFGTAGKTNVPFEGGNKIPPNWPSIGSASPAGMPYESPDIEHDPQNPLDFNGYPEYYGFVQHIKEWMSLKGIPPQTGDLLASAALIASEIITNGQHAHPFMRNAWFDNELQIKRAAKHALSNATR